MVQGDVFLKYVLWKSDILQELRLCIFPCMKHHSGATLDILEILEYKNSIEGFVFQRPSPPKQLKGHSSSSPSGSFILFNEFLPSAQIWDSRLVNKLNLFDFCQV